jgi:FkbM family methyltransferase
MSLKVIIQSTLNSLGYDIYKRDSRFHPEIAVMYLCAKYQLSTVLDVGANTGQFVQALRKWGYAKNVLSFEPLSSAHASLKQNAAHDPYWQVAPRCAIGASKAVSEINIAGNSVSSSILPMLEIHRQAAPDSAYLAKEEVQIESLSNMIQQLTDQNERFFLKIDTQGYEREVISGASCVLERIPAIQMELSISPLYENSLLLDEGIELMKSHGYRVYSIYQGLSDRKTGETLQVDAIFVR